MAGDFLFREFAVGAVPAVRSTEEFHIAMGPDKINRLAVLPVLHPTFIVEAADDIAGGVIRYQTPPTRNGNRVVYVIMEDGTGVADVTVFSDVQERCGQVLFRAGWMTVTGKIQRRGPKALSIIAEDLSALEPAKIMI